MKPLHSSGIFGNSLSSAFYFSTNSQPIFGATVNDPTPTPDIENIFATPVRPVELDELVLYERDVMHPDAMRTTTFMRSGFVLSSFHTWYWIWYTFDFIPHVNKAAMEVLHVDPMIGVAGIVIAMSLQAAFVIYPLRLISKLVYRKDEKRICIYTHRIPSMYPALRRPSTSFPLGTSNTAHNTVMVSKQQLMKASSTEDIKILNEKTKAAAAEAAKSNVKYFTLDANTPTALNLIQGECQGDISKFRGHLVVGPRWPKYVLDIKDSKEVKESALLLQALLKPEHFYYKGVRNYSNNDYGNEKDLSSGSKLKNPVATPFQLRKRARPRSSAQKTKNRR